MVEDVSDLTPMLYNRDETVHRFGNEPSRTTKIKNAITMLVLFLINLLNYMDRYSIAGVLGKIQVFFNIGNQEGGLLQTVFICSYMALAPLFGYLGDRYSRKLMIILGVTLWSITTMAGSFVSADKFWLFVVFRCLVGVGEASYSCVAPTIIADMYKDDMRTTMLAVFNIAVPLGSGLGYIVGSYVTKLFNGEWQWALRVTPILGVVCVILLIFLVTEPERGSIEGANTRIKSNWFNDVKSICKIKSYILLTLGFTWVSFALGSLAWFGPIFLEKGHKLAYGNEDSNDKQYVELLFGIITAGAGIVGVYLGSEVARRYRKKNPRGDPIVCGIAVVLAMPFLYLVLVLSNKHLTSTWICITFAETLLCTNWALITDMLMYIIIPTRRSTASSIQIFIMHLFGDATSPYIIGKISDFLLKERVDNLSDWLSLRNALMLTPFVATLGAGAFLFASLYIIQDRRNAEETMQSMKVSDDIGMYEKS